NTYIRFKLGGNPKGSKPPPTSTTNILSLRVTRSYRDHTISPLPLQIIPSKKP
ncbi:hypothetical protein GIB67_029387, partial [Kingdonia uniflora]